MPWLRFYLSSLLLLVSNAMAIAWIKTFGCNRPDDAAELRELMALAESKKAQKLAELRSRGML